MSACVQPDRRFLIDNQFFALRRIEEEMALDSFSFRRKSVKETTDVDCARPSELQLTNLSKSCLLHALVVIVDDDQPSSLDRIKKFCEDLLLQVQRNGAPKRRPSLKQDMDVETQPTFDPAAIKSFLKGEATAKQFQEVLEREMVQRINGDFDYNAMFSICWKVYRERQRPDSKAEVFSKQHPPEKDDCMYYLWLIFNAVISPEEKAMVMPVKCLDVIMTRLFELCGHECSSEELVYSTAHENLDYPGYLKAIANYCEKFSLKSSLTCEVSKACIHNDIVSYTQRLG